MDTTEVAAAIERLRARDETLARVAGRAYEILVSGVPLCELAVQRFAWLASRELDTRRSRFMAVGALACLLEECGYQRYALICRSWTTSRILWASDRAAERRTARAAWRSGIWPPHHPELGLWAPATERGAAERAAYYEVSAHLELAIQAGELVPHLAGREQRRLELSHAYLVRPRHELAGRSHLEAIAEERAGGGGTLWSSHAS